MNTAQLENIELRLAAVRGRPWVVARGSVQGEPLLAVGRSVDGKTAFQRSQVDALDGFEFCTACHTMVSAAQSGGPPPWSRLCSVCQNEFEQQMAASGAAFFAHKADRDECSWLAKAPEDIDALIRAVRSLSSERDALRRSFDAERQKAKDACDERSIAQQELARIKASLATLKELL